MQYCLINSGVILMRHGSSEPPVTRVKSQLLYDEQLYTPTGTLTDATLALLRDLNERKILANWAIDVPPPVVTFTRWTDRAVGRERTWHGSLYGVPGKARRVSASPRRLCRVEAATAGYVDKPAANLVLRLLEVMALPEIDAGGSPAPAPAAAASVISTCSKGC